MIGGIRSGSGRRRRGRGLLRRRLSGSGLELRVGPVVGIIFDRVDCSCPGIAGVRPRGLKPLLSWRFRGAEAPLFHGGG